jgi:hypothetical protein
MKLQSPLNTLQLIQCHLLIKWLCYIELVNIKCSWWRKQKLFYCRNERYALVCDSPCETSAPGRAKWVWPDEPLQTTESVHYRPITTAIADTANRWSHGNCSSEIRVWMECDKKKTNIKTSIRITVCLSWLQSTSTEFKSYSVMKESLRLSWSLCLLATIWRLMLQEDLIRLLLRLNINPRVDGCAMFLKVETQTLTVLSRIYNMLISNAWTTSGLVVTAVVCNCVRTLLQMNCSLRIQFLIRCP